MTVISAPGLPSRMFEEKEGAGKKFRQDPDGEDCKSPILGQCETDKRNRRDSNQKED
jgi:hypothetical protein